MIVFKISTLVTLFFLMFFQETNNRIELINADVQEILAQDLIKLTGNVIIKNDSAIIYCSRANLYKEKGYIELFDSVKIIYNKSNIIKSNKAYFWSKLKKAKFVEKANFRNDKVNTFSDTLTYFKEKNISFLAGNASAVDEIGKQQSFGDLIINNNNSIISVFGRAKFYQIKDSLKVEADSLILYKTEQYSTAKSKVKVSRGNIVSYSDFGLFNQKDSVFKLIGNPVITYENNRLQGDTIYSYLSNNSLKQIDIRGSALTLNTVDSINEVINKVYGQRIIIDFENKKMKQLKSIYNAISIYYIKETREGEGTNSVSSDSLKINFVDGKIHDIYIFGGVEGTYYPPNYHGVIKNDY